jgi:voltage-gated potassium channel
MKRLQRARELGAYEEWQRRTDKPMLIISVLFLLVILVPVVFTSLPLSVRNTLTVIETILWIVFVVDYLVRFLLAPKRWRFFWTHIPELLVISVPVLRPLRSLQVLRLLRLGGVGTVANRLAQRSLQGHAVLLVSAITLILVLTVAGIALIFERGNPHATITSYPEALWWALSTVTTVGYGDIYPVTSGGRLAGLLLMLAGISLAGIITAAVAAWFVQAVVKQADEVEEEKNTADASVQQETVLQRLDALEARLAQVDAGVKRILALLGASHPVSQDKIDHDYKVQTRSEGWGTQPTSETEPGKKALGG